MNNPSPVEHPGPAHDDPHDFDPPSEASVRAGHESAEIDAGRMTRWLVLTALLLAATHYVIRWQYDLLERGQRLRDAPQPPLADEGTPPPPQLQPAPKVDMQAFRRAEADFLESYGWINRERKIVRLPIDRAIELMAQRGLPEPASPRQRDARPPTWDTDIPPAARDALRPQGKLPPEFDEHATARGNDSAPENERLHVGPMPLVPVQAPSGGRRSTTDVEVERLQQNRNEAP